LLLVYELGIKQLYICPDLNYGAAVHADKWIPILPIPMPPCSGHRLMSGWRKITYDKEYLKTHAVGYDKFFDYVLR
jgi:trimethylamine-N-oxide reductase (cytochrome c)